MAIGCEAGAEQAEHVFAAEVLDFGERFSLDGLHQHGGSSLADAATDAAEPGLADTVAIERQVDTNNIAAERIVVFVRVRGSRASTAMIGLLEMIEDAFLVEFVFIALHVIILPQDGTKTRCAARTSLQAAVQRE